MRVVSGDANPPYWFWVLYGSVPKVTRGLQWHRLYNIWGIWIELIVFTTWVTALFAHLYLVFYPSMKETAYWQNGLNKQPNLVSGSSKAPVWLGDFVCKVVRCFVILNWKLNFLDGMLGYSKKWYEGHLKSRPVDHRSNVPSSWVITTLYFVSLLKISLCKLRAICLKSWTVFQCLCLYLF